MVSDIEMQRYRDKKIRVCDKNSIPLFVYNQPFSKLFPSVRVEFKNSNKPSSPLGLHGTVVVARSRGIHKNYGSQKQGRTQELW